MQAGASRDFRLLVRGVQAGVFHGFIEGNASEMRKNVELKRLFKRLKSMDTILKGLNYEQRQAVLHETSREGALLVLAGAGKTSGLTRRIQ